MKYSLLLKVDVVIRVREHALVVGKVVYTINVKRNVAVHLSVATCKNFYAQHCKLIYIIE